MQYADSVQQVLIRKINRAEQDLVQLKLDYCRFIFGLTHRSQVEVDGTVYQVRSVDVETMVRRDDGSFEKPELAGSPVGEGTVEAIKPLGKDWSLVGEQGGGST